jgi:hypothetical protein
MGRRSAPIEQGHALAILGGSSAMKQEGDHYEQLPQLMDASAPAAQHEKLATAQRVVAQHMLLSPRFHTDQLLVCLAIEEEEMPTATFLYWWKQDPHGPGGIFLQDLTSGRDARSFTCPDRSFIGLRPGLQ